MHDALRGTGLAALLVLGASVGAAAQDSEVEVEVQAELGVEKQANLSGEQQVAEAERQREVRQRGHRIRADVKRDQRRLPLETPPVRMKHPGVHRSMVRVPVRTIKRSLSAQADFGAILAERLHSASISPQYDVLR